MDLKTHALPPAWIIPGIWSVPGYLCPFCLTLAICACCKSFSLPNIISPMYIQQLTQVILARLQYTLTPGKHITLHVPHWATCRLVTPHKFSYAPTQVSNIPVLAVFVTFILSLAFRYSTFWFHKCLLLYYFFSLYHTLFIFSCII